MLTNKTKALNENVLGIKLTSSEKYERQEVVNALPQERKISSVYEFDSVLFQKGREDW